MKKLTILSVILVFTLLLASCADSGETPGEGTLVPGVGTEVGGIGTDVAGAEGTIGVPVTGTEVGGMATQAATEAGSVATATQAVGSETEVATAESTGTQVAGAGGEGLEDANINLLSELLDEQIVDNQCNVLGEVDSVLVDRSGTISYVVVDAEDDVLLADDDTVLLPWGALDVNMDLNDFSVDGQDGTGVQSTPVGTDAAGQATTAPGAVDSTLTPAVGSDSAAQCELFFTGDALMLNVDAAVLADLPALGVDDDLGSAIGASDWDADLRSFWSGQGVQVPEAGEEFGSGDMAGSGTDAATQPAGGQIGSVVQIGDLGDLELVNSVQDDLGEIEDFVVDPEAGQITHVLLSVGGFLGIGERYVPVPFSASNWTVGEDGMYTVVVDADQARLEAAPGFDSLRDFPDISVPDWDSEFQMYWESDNQ